MTMTSSTPPAVSARDARFGLRVLSSARDARFGLRVLSIVYAVHLLDRQILSMLLGPIKEDLRIPDTALGFLTGTSFALLDATAGIPIARWADRGTRTHMIALGLVL
jgi:predicted MFS family arabinose efflux permease